MSVIFLAKGHTHLGMSKRDENGNITETSQAHFEFAPDGPCVAVGEMDPETNEVNSDSVSIFGDWDAAGYLANALELLKPCRSINIPDLKAIVQNAYQEDGNDLLCDYCKSMNCHNCIIKDWKEEME